MVYTKISQHLCVEIVLILSIAGFRFYRLLEYQRVYLPLYKVANTPFYIQGDVIFGKNSNKMSRLVYMCWFKLCIMSVILLTWNESGFRPPLCTYRLNWARRTSWGWWDDCDDTVLQTQDSKFEPWRSEAEHATSRSRRLPTILTFTRGWGKNIFVSYKPPRPGTEPRTLAWKAAVLTTTLGPPPLPTWSCASRQQESTSNW